MIKTILSKKGIPFEYTLLSSLSEEAQTCYTDLANSKGITQFPLIIKDDKLLSFEEVTSVL